MGIRELPVSTWHSPSAAATQLPRACLEAASDGVRHLELSGPLPPTWCLRLLQGLAGLGISVVEGYALRSEAGTWTARLALDVDASIGAQVDFLALATRSRSAPPLAEPRLLDFELALSPRPPFALHLEVHAWDAVGLLAGVLERAAAVGLHPAGLILETQEDCAFHHVMLRDPARERPSPVQQRSLERTLGSLLSAG